MPLWQLFTPENAYTPEEKADLADKITNIYSSDWSRENLGFVLPRFYTSVVFHEIKADDFYVGGESRSNFIQIEVVHIARTNEGAAALAGITVEEILRRYFENVNDFLKPYTADRGYEVEFHVEAAPFETWQIDGMVPPVPHSEAEQRWYKENRSSPYVAGNPSEDMRMSPA
ncbi:tautomerase family protein [Arthrobacter sp. BE255]|uniref:tautomerase family protein n=1 Tax=Arthrobacter sp. BE255 TaxID=2817721 RepID=UPI0028673E73|nr:tautomerase family protein [Arthrobacter sp. BE255]MDR7159124.1 phenylpyruvate tautomerase PptA (4-oxalocrotonate tautomerase family) [Arthrobacter sp. BE255]